METTKRIVITRENIEEERMLGGYIFKITHPELNDGEPIELRLKDEDYDEETRFFAGEQFSQDLWEQLYRKDYDLISFSKDTEDYILDKFDYISEDDLPDRVEPFTIEELKKYFPDYELEKLDSLKDDDDRSILRFNRHYEYYVRKASKPGYYDLVICDC